jgi:hypothetical protein
MSTLSHVHQFFHAETCHAYLHALRWQDRGVIVQLVQIVPISLGCKLKALGAHRICFSNIINDVLRF